MKTEKEIDDFIELYRTLYEDGYNKFCDAEELFVAFSKEATNEDLLIVAKKSQKRLKELKTQEIFTEQEKEISTPLSPAFINKKYN